MRQSSTGRLDGEEVPFDLAANAASWGADVLRCGSMAEFRENYVVAAASDRTTVLYIETDLLGPNPPGSAWWDVPVSQVSALESTQQAFAEHLENQRGAARPTSDGPAADRSVADIVIFIDGMLEQMLDSTG